MIVYTKDDVVRLKGALVKNQWLTIKAAADLLLQDHPQGIIIDCSELDRVSEDGAKTFLQAMHDIQSAGARMMVANLPENVLQVLRTVPGVRSQLPIAGSLEEARASLQLSAHAPATDGLPGTGAGGILVPLVASQDLEYTLAVAGRIARDLRQPVMIVYLLEVARNLPLGTPLPEEEKEANLKMNEAARLAQARGLHPSLHLERVREAEEGLMHIIKNYKATHVVVATSAEGVNDEEFQVLLDLLLHRAPCEVIIGRRAK